MPEKRYDAERMDWEDYPGTPVAEGSKSRYIGESALMPVEAPAATEEEDPLWSDYGRMILSGGIQIGSGVGWLANNFEWGQSLQTGASELSRSFMDDLSPQAKRAMATEFTSRDEGQLWTNNKWSKAKLIAAQSLLGTAAGMGVGSVLTRGLAAAGMTKTVMTAAGTAAQVPTRTAGAIGYGLGEAGVAAPGSAAGVEEEIMAMSHVDLLENAADYRAIYLALENADPAERARRAKEILAKAAAGDTFYRNLVSTFILSAPLGAIVGGYAGKVPMLGATTRTRSVGVGALGEATQEFLQSGAEKMGENIAMQRAGFDRPTMGGVLEEAVGGAMAGGMMGGTVGGFTALDSGVEGQVLPDKESPLSALAQAEQDELDAQLDAELAEQDRAEREAENQALRDFMDEEADFGRAKDMTIMEGERAQQLEAQRQSQIDEEYRRRSAREAADRGSLPGEPETIAQQQQREYEDELREIWDIDAEEERMQRVEALQKEIDAGRMPHLRTTALAERINTAGPHPQRQYIEERINEETGETQLVMVTESYKAGGERQDTEELFATGGQPAEGEVVAGLPVETAGPVRGATSMELAMEEAREKQKTRTAEDLLKPVPTVADRRKSKMGEPVAPDELVEPPKPDLPPTTKAFNPRRDNIIIAAAKTRGLDKDAWAAEGVDPNEFKEPENAYGSKRAFRAGGMTPDEATEWAAELGFVAVDEHGKAEPHAALDAIMETLGGKPVYTLEGAQYGAEQDRYQAALDELAQKTQRQEGIAGEWNIEVDGIEVHIVENTIGDVTVTYGDNETITERMEGESNRDLVRAILQSEAAGDGVIREKPVEGAPQSEEEQIAFERTEGKRIVDEMLPGDTGMVEATEEQVNDLEDAFFADGWKFNAAKGEYRKGNRVANLTELEEGRWQVIWDVEAAPEAAPVEKDLFGAEDLDDFADTLGEQISLLTPESSTTDRNAAMLDLGRLKRARHPRADDLARRIKDALQIEEEIPGQELKLGWMPATLRVRIMGDSAQSFSRLDKTTLQAYAIRIGISDQGTKLDIAKRIKDAVATIQEAEIDLEAAEPIADVVERKAKYQTKKKLTKQQKEALVKAVALAQISTDGEVLVDDLSARNVGGQAIDGLVQKGTIELVGEQDTYFSPGSKFRVKYMPEPTHPMARPAVPRAQPLGETGIVEEEEEIPSPNEARRQRLREIRNMLDRREGELGEDRRTVEREADRRQGERRQRGETEDEFEARLEREAIQGEEDLETEELGEIPGFEDLEAETATSPESDMPMPTEGQKDAGNYKKAHITIKGLLITIENAVGSIRNGFKMLDHYGYIKRTEGVDGDQVDVFVNPEIRIDFNNQVYIIDQTDAKGQFDEHKVMLGYASKGAAVRAYRSNYEEDWTVGPVTEMPMADFKLWLADDAATKRPVASAPRGRPARVSAQGATPKKRAVREGKPRSFRYSKKIRTDARVEDAKASVNAPNKAWVAAALRKLPSQAETSEEALDTLITDLETLEEALTELDEQEAVVRAYDRPQVERDTKQLRDAVTAEITVLDDYTQAPAEIVAEMEREGMTDVAGVTDPKTGDIYLFSDKMVDADHANRVAIHEITHSGLQAAFGKGLNRMLLDLSHNIPTELQARADEIVEVYGLDIREGEAGWTDRIEMADELVAHGAEHFPNLPIIKKFIAKIRRMLRQIGIVGQWTENDVIALMVEAQGAIKRRGRSLEGITFDEDVEVEETGEVFTIERDAQESLDQIEKRKQSCERIKSCL